MFYTHVSDQYDPFHIKAITATAHQAPYVLDGLLYHETDLQVQEHYTDTGSVTDHLFALCPPLGFQFAPRIRDLADRRLYTIEAPSNYPSLEPLIGGMIQLKRLEDHWDDILRVLTSIRLGTVTASLLMRKLAAYPRQNALALALRDMGRIERTLYVLEWLQSPELRRRVTVGLNKGEAKNALARAIFFNRRGVVQDRAFEDQQSRASGLNVVLAAIILWNTLALEQAVEKLRAQGVSISEEYLQHLAPLGWEKIILTGSIIGISNTPTLYWQHHRRTRRQCLSVHEDCLESSAAVLSVQFSQNDLVTPFTKNSLVVSNFSALAGTCCRDTLKERLTMR